MSYRINDGRLNFILTGGATGSAEVALVDWKRTSQLNSAPGTTETLDSRAY